jgi:hypothetical protein
MKIRKVERKKFCFQAGLHREIRRLESGASEALSFL